MLLEDIVPKTDKIIQDIESACGRYLKSNGRGGLYRGSSNTQAIRVISTYSMKLPKSANARAYFSRFLFNSVVYKKFGIQNILSKSLNCVNSSESAHQFGSNVYEVYPSDETKIIYNEHLDDLINFSYELMRGLKKLFDQDTVDEMSEIVKQTYGDSYEGVIRSLNDKVSVGQHQSIDEAIGDLYDKFHSIINEFVMVEAHQRIESISKRSKKTEFMLFDSREIYMIEEDDVVNSKIHNKLAKQDE